MSSPDTAAAHAKPLRIGIVAGEASGDQLGAALIRALRERHPEATFCGVGGPKMRAAGLDVWEDSEALAVMGLAEVLQHLPRLLRLRRELVERFRRERPDVFIGIDSPEFNLGLAKRLKAAGLRTVQYVSPQVWAWRQGRVRTIGEACDLVLCLLPFETRFYADHGVRAEFVGHPLADQIPLEPDRSAARASLGLDAQAPLVALLPGSRLVEVSRLARDFVGAARWLAARRPDVRFVAPMASAAVRAQFELALRDIAPDLPVSVIDGRSHEALAAGDVALVASGTATLETMLSKRPMVVAYRLSGLSAFLLRGLGMLKVEHIAQPNLLAGRLLVPEFVQEAVTPEALGAALEAQLADPARTRELVAEFTRLHVELRLGGAARATDAIDTLLGASP